MRGDKAKTVETYFQRYVIEGGVMMIFLIPCSFFAVWFIFQGLINLRRSRIVPQNLLDRAEGVKSSKEFEDFMKALINSASSLGNIFQGLFRGNSASATHISDEEVVDAIDDEISRLYHKNNQLAAIYTVSPLLGLLGTILGMMKTFYVFALSEEHSIAQLSKGINEALVTTMWGLMIAIPAYVALYFFRQRLFSYEMNLLPDAVRKILRHYEEHGKD